MTSYEKNQVDKTIELLKLCETLQSDKDGCLSNQLSKDILASVLLVSNLHVILPFQERLINIGKHLENKGLITVDYGDSYPEKALEYMELKPMYDDIKDFEEAIGSPVNDTFKLGWKMARLIMPGTTQDDDLAD